MKGPLLQNVWWLCLNNTCVASNISTCHRLPSFVFGIVDTHLALFSSSSNRCWQHQIWAAVEGWFAMAIAGRFACYMLQIIGVGLGNNNDQTCEFATSYNIWLCHGVLLCMQFHITIDVGIVNIRKRNCNFGFQALERTMILQRNIVHFHDLPSPGFCSAWTFHFKQHPTFGHHHRSADFGDIMRHVR